ncbi:CBS domain-containing protein, partial [Leuconostoc lactis]|uniref:CBS domain-containing protein n=1 Tax=Leuconostoc lactis TaxID=1246 RepID=UPI00289FF753
QQRVGLARALTNDPDILLMDEAFSALDPLVRGEMQEELLELQANVRKTIIFITHDLNEALHIGDHIAIMKDGQLQQVGTGEEILTNPANDYVRTFIGGVDRTKVLTAESIMIPALTTNLTVDGPTVALRKMSDEEVSGLVAVNRNRELLGYLSSDAAVTARREKTPLTEVVSEMPTVSLDTLIVDIMPIIYDAQTPVAVVDDSNRVKGVIIRGGVLEALADTQGEDEHA